MTALPLSLSEVSLHAGGRALLRDVSADIAAGGSTVILGPNGAGKSLLLRLCHGLLTPSAGAVRWLGPDAAEARRRQAMVFQRPVMLRRSVRANLDYPIKLRGVAATARARLVDEALQQAGLIEQAAQPAATLSAGEQQRVSLVRAHLLDPDIMFLDEPTASLDPAATGRIEQMIGEISREGVKIVMTTHDLGQARRLADEVIFLHNGQLIERAPAADFFAAPQSPEARAYLEGRLLW